MTLQFSNTIGLLKIGIKHQSLEYSAFSQRAHDVISMLKLRYVSTWFPFLVAQFYKIVQNLVNFLYLNTNVIT